MQTQEDHIPTLLVVEDDVIVRIVIADDLRLAGFEVIEAGNGAEAMSLLSGNRRIDVVFSDIHMPGGVNGIALAGFVIDRFPQTRIILTTGSDDGQDLAMATGLHLIRKPYRPETVIATVALVLKEIDSVRTQTGLSSRG